MPKPLKYLFAAIAVLFTVTLAVIVYVVTWDPNEHKDWIAGKFQESTGRTLTLGGDVALSWYPWLGLSVEDLRIGNAEGFGDEPFVQADAAVLRLKLMPILQGRYEIDTIRLAGADINLEVNEAGVGNWEDLAAGDAQEEAPPPRGEGLSLANVVLGGVDISDASLSLDDRQAGVRYAISDFDMATGALVFGQPIELDLSFDAESSEPQLAAAVRLDGTVAYDEGGSRYDIAPLTLDATLRGPNVPNGSADISLASSVALDLEADTLDIPELNLQALGSQLRASLSGQGVQGGAARYESSFELAGADLAVFFRVLENQALAERIAALGSQDFQLAAALAYDMGRGDLRLSSLRGDLLGATLAGDFGAANLQSETPQFRGNLSASGPDLPTLLEVAGQVQGGNASPFAQYGRQLAGVSDKAFDLAAEFDADLGQGLVQVPVLSASLLGFDLDGSLTARGMNAADGNVEGSLALSGDNLGEVLAAVGQADLAEVAQSMTLRVDVGGSRRDLAVGPVDLDLVLSGPDIPNSPATLSLDADSRVNLEEDSLVLERFTLSGLGLDLSGDLQASSLREAPRYSGNLALQPFDLRALLGQLNLEVPDMADPETLRRVVLDAGFSGTQSAFELGSLTLGLDETTLQGSASVTDFDNPAVSFDIAIDRLDADRYLAPPAEPAAAEAAPPAEIPSATLRDLRVDGQLAIASLSVANLDLSDLTLGLRAADGRLSAEPAMNLYEGSFAGNLGLDVSGAVPAATLESTLSGVALGPLLQDLIDAATLSGSGNVELALQTSGNDTAQMLTALDGGGRIELQDGVLRGVDVGAVLSQVELMIRERRLRNIQRGEATPFEAFSATLSVMDGVVSSNDLLVDASGFSVSGRGTLVDLTDDSIAFDLTATVEEDADASEQYDIGGYSLPIACTGTIDSPRCLPDTAEIARAAVQRNVTDLLERALGGGEEEADPSQQDQPQPEGAQEAPAEPAPERDPGQELLDRAIENIFGR